MESEVLSEEVEREVARVAAAFEIKEWELNPKHNLPYTSEGFIGPRKLVWRVEMAEWSVLRLKRPVGKSAYQTLCKIARTRCPPALSQWSVYVDTGANQRSREIMARGLYCLGFEDEGALATLNYPLTAHEKLELRLSLPREFWPQKWIDEDAPLRQSF